MPESASGSSISPPSATGITVIVPRSSREKAQLKRGFVDAKQDELSYFRLPLLIPSLLFTVLSSSSFIFAATYALTHTVAPSMDDLLRGVLLPYGTTRIPCNTTVPLPRDGLPSLLTLFELNVIANVLFRISVVLPIMLRIFQSLAIRHMVRACQNTGLIFEVTTDVIPSLTAMESFSLALFAIVTIHSDFPDGNRFFKLVFAISSCLNMLAITTVMFQFKANTRNKLDSTSLLLKMLSACVYCYIAPQYFQRHHAITRLPLCHAYISRVYALLEYGMIASFALFHLTTLIDIRHLHFICYPRVCSGECEPLDPANFVKGGKYEHCRAFEYNQRKREEEEKKKEESC